MNSTEISKDNGINNNYNCYINKYWRMDESNLRKLTYKQLQSLAAKYNVPGNIKVILYDYKLLS